MKLSLLYHTSRHLRLRQLVYQVWYRLYKPSYAPVQMHSLATLPHMLLFPRKEKSYIEGDFTFISLKGEFIHWQDTSRGMLWTYNLNYMDWLLQEELSYEEGKDWIDRFIADLPVNKIGQDPYPTALRIINWIKFICLHREHIQDDTRLVWDASLRAQVDLLTRKLEYHLLANHLLEDVCALFIASIYLFDEALSKRSSKLLKAELLEQILPDGAHYEQAPMYHCILLERLLDCYNFASANTDKLSDSSILDVLRGAVVAMLGHLDSIVYKDGSIPLVNDSAYGIALPYETICAYARSLGLDWCSIPLAESGYRWLRNGTLEVLVDVGNVTAVYQPGHTHADSLSYELRMDGKPLVVDTGISTYNKTPRRDYERSTSAHNTVVVEGRSSSQTWGGFRVGRRAQTTLLLDIETRIQAQHDGYGKSCVHRREFVLEEDGFKIRDSIPQDRAVSLLHLAPSIKILSINLTEVHTSVGAIIEICGAEQVVITEEYISRRYNQKERVYVLEILFSKDVEYFIRKNR